MIKLGQKIELNSGAMHPVMNGLVVDFAADQSEIVIAFEDGKEQVVTPDRIRNKSESKSPIGIFFVN